MRTSTSEPSSLCTSEKRGLLTIVAARQGGPAGWGDCTRWCRVALPHRGDSRVAFVDAHLSLAHPDNVELTAAACQTVTSAWPMVARL